MTSIVLEKQDQAVRGRGTSQYAKGKGQSLPAQHFRMWTKRIPHALSQDGGPSLVLHSESDYCLAINRAYLTVDLLLLEGGACPSFGGVGVAYEVLLRGSRARNRPFSPCVTNASSDEH